MDGAAYVTQYPINVGDTFEYRFNVGHQYGTYWYHSHVARQIPQGLFGAFIIGTYTFAPPFFLLHRMCW